MLFLLLCCCCCGSGSWWVVVVVGSVGVVVVVVVGVLWSCCCLGRGRVLLLLCRRWGVVALLLRCRLFGGGVRVVAVCGCRFCCFVGLLVFGCCACCCRWCVVVVFCLCVVANGKIGAKWRLMCPCSVHVLRWLASAVSPFSIYWLFCCEVGGLRSLFVSCGTLRLVS